MKITDNNLAVRYESEKKLPLAMEKVTGITLAALYIETVAADMAENVRESVCDMLQDTIKMIMQGEGCGNETIISINHDEFEKQLKEMKNNENE